MISNGLSKISLANVEIDCKNYINQSKWNAESEQKIFYMCKK